MNRALVQIAVGGSEDGAEDDQGQIVGGQTVADHALLFSLLEASVDELDGAGLHGADALATLLSGGLGKLPGEDQANEKGVFEQEGETLPHESAQAIQRVGPGGGEVLEEHFLNDADGRQNDVLFGLEMPKQCTVGEAYLFGDGLSLAKNRI
jgi:hypothetical protein